MHETCDGAHHSLAGEIDFDLLIFQICENKQLMVSRVQEMVISQRRRFDNVRSVSADIKVRFHLWQVVTKSSLVD